jgi:hypothetical protein
MHSGVQDPVPRQTRNAGAYLRPESFLREGGRKVSQTAHCTHLPDVEGKCILTTRIT